MIPYSVIVRMEDLADAIDMQQEGAPMRPEVKTCPACFGRGNRPVTETYTDRAQSAALGLLLGGGWLPVTRTRVVLKPCHACGGSGKAKRT